METLGTTNIEILLGILTFTASTGLGLFILFKEPKSSTNRLFALLALIINIYIIVNYISLHPPLATPESQLFWVRLVMFTTSFIGPVLVLLVHTFPEKKIHMKGKFLIALGILMTSSAVASLLPLVFSSITYPAGEPVPVPGPGIIIFLLDFVGLFILSFGILIYRYRKASADIKPQFRDLLFGIISSFSLMALCTVIFVVALKSSATVFLGPIFPVILMAAIGYAIVKHKLFNAKVIATQALVIMIWIVLFSKVLTPATLAVKLADIFVFAATLPFGFLLIRSVIKEVKLAEQQYEMVATVSHQLRTPLTPVLGYAAMMDQGDFDGHPEELKDAQHRLLLSTQRLRNIINDFLQMFELEGDHKMDLTKTPLQDIVNEAMAGVKENYEQKSLYLKLENPGNVNPTLVGETKLLVQAINNLLDNAQRYTTEGGTTVQLSVEKGHAIIRVSDTGIGLDENDKQRLFTKFYRSDAAKEVRPDGSGLGLPIVRTVVEAHGGKVHAESEGRGKGTTFIIELPLKKN